MRLADIERSIAAQPERRRLAQRKKKKDIAEGKRFFDSIVDPLGILSDKQKQQAYKPKPQPTMIQKLLGFGKEAASALPDVARGFIDPFVETYQASSPGSGGETVSRFSTPTPDFSNPVAHKRISDQLLSLTQQAPKNINFQPANRLPFSIESKVGFIPKEDRPDLREPGKLLPNVAQVALTLGAGEVLAGGKGLVGALARPGLRAVNAGFTGVSALDLIKRRKDLGARDAAQILLTALGVVGAVKGARGARNNVVAGEISTRRALMEEAAATMARADEQAVQAKFVDAIMQSQKPQVALQSSNPRVFAMPEQNPAGVVRRDFPGTPESPGSLGLHRILGTEPNPVVPDTRLLPRTADVVGPEPILGRPKKPLTAAQILRRKTSTPLPPGQRKLAELLGGKTEKAKVAADGGTAVAGAPVKPELANKIEQATPDVGDVGLKDFTKLLLRKQNSRIANIDTIATKRNWKIKRAFDKMSNDEQVVALSNYERTGNAGPGLEKYSKYYKQSTDESLAKLKSVYDNVGYVDNYVKRLFDFKTDADSVNGISYLQEKTRKTLGPNKSATKGRVLDVPLDEALQNMRDRGIDVKLATGNMEDLRRITAVNAEHAVAFRDTLYELKTRNMITPIKNNRGLPKGYVKLDDKVFDIYQFNEDPKGFIKRGQYAAPKEVAEVLNKAVSSGLEGLTGYRFLHKAENVLNSLQLGLSSFHAVTTGVNSAVSKASLGARELLTRGSRLKGLKDLALSPVTPITDIIKGSKLLNDERFINNELTPSGGRVARDAQYRLGAIISFRKAARDAQNSRGLAKGKNYGKAVWQAPQALLEAAAQPIMDYQVPRAKLAAFKDLAEFEVKRLGKGATQAEIDLAKAHAWDSIDNRFGQLVQDNLFWKKTNKDMLNLSMRSAGWNVGSVRELGGGLKDLARGKVTARTAYAATLPVYVGLMGAVYQYLHTGEAPKEMLDYFHPKNGDIDDEGRPVRVSMPSYLKDVGGITRAPLETIINKASPVLTVGVNTVFTNKDSWGDMIRNPDDPATKQLLQTINYAKKQMQPLTVQQFIRATKSNESFINKTEFGVGVVTKAPRAVTETPFQQKTYALLTKQLGGRISRTPEQVDIDTMKSQARKEINSGGKSPALVQLIKSGAVKDKKAFNKKAQLTSTERAFSSLSRESQLTALKEATPAERKRYQRLLKKTKSSNWIY